MEQIKGKITFKNFINTLFGTGIDDSYENFEISDPALFKAQSDANKLVKEIETAVVSEGNKTSKNGGFSNGLRKDTLDKMREQLQRGIKVEKNENEKGIER